MVRKSTRSGPNSSQVELDLEFGLGIGHIVPSDFLKNTNHPAAYTYPYVMMSYNIF